MNRLKGLIRAALRFYAECNNERYVKMLRKKGISVGEDVVFRNPHSTLIDESRPSLVTIGNHVDINVNFQIYTHDWTSFVFLNLYHDFVNSSGKVTIGDNVYIGANVMVLKGVTIGDNCIIGAGSIVNRSIPSGSVAVGNPCRVICTVEEFYERRRRKSLDEAVEYAKSITERYNREPEPSDFWEEFVLFVDKSNIDRYPEIPVRRQLAVGYDDWLRNHKARFGSFDEFLEYVKVQKRNNYCKREMKPCVSIIVPVYKAEKYLDRCVESLIGQTLQNIEVILVDDGSPDSSAAICDRWAEREPRIKVIHKPNGGPGSARNAGIEVATGEYITFVDSDDYVLVDTYSTLYSEAVTGGYDAVYNGYTYYYPDGSKEEKAITDRRYDDVKSYIGDMLADDDIVISVCMGIYRASIIRECALKFIPECEYEDLVFNFDFLIGASKVRCLPRAFYQYCYNGGSLSQSFSNSKVASGIRLHENLKERLRSNGIEDLSGKEEVFFIGMTVGLMKSLMLSDLSLGEKRAAYAGFYEYKGWKELQKAVGGSVPATKRLLVFLIRHKLFYLSYLLFKLYYGIVKK